jgi:hypothetical protein
VPTRAELTLSALDLITQASAENLLALSLVRGVTPESSWTVYDLARAMVAPEAVWRQLTTLDRDTLVAVDSLLPVPQRNKKTPAPTTARLAEVHLVTTGPGNHLLPRPEVTEAISLHQGEWSKALGEQDPVTPAPPSGLKTPPQDQVGRHLPGIISVLDRLAQLIRTLLTAEITSRKSLPTMLAKALDAAAPWSAESWDEAIDWGIEAKLIHWDGVAWLATHDGVEFLGLGEDQQLAFLIRRWWEQAPQPCRVSVSEAGGSGGVAPDSFSRMAVRYPLLDRVVVSAWLERGQRWGLVSDGQPTSLVYSLGRGESIDQTLSSLFPERATSVYPDSVDSLVAAGPLSAEAREVIDRIARRVQGGMTPRWRLDRDVTLQSLITWEGAALVDTANSVVTGGLPGSMASQILEWDARAKSLTVSPHPSGTVISCTDDYLATLLTVDHKLEPLQLSRVDDHTLSSVRPCDQVRHLLLGAGYPTLPEPTQPANRRVWSAVVSVSVADQWWDTIIAQANDMPATAVWTEEVLREAIAERTKLSLCVRFGESDRWLVVEPRSVSRGRLRAKDTLGDVERTLPLSTIVAIELAPTGLDKSA